ncbi:imidazole glycerol phosphate synthase subunit HisH [Tractidigestivibacter scatoligenes]|jgi:glutamine amidotransferase|uniref:imidazole glycerol phosphate synthase subunit HisH n=1 Tax=Tractidigestivibacter scatoligenes TaxID=1299998 RepID=UPI002F359262
MASAKIVVIDYHKGNLLSVQHGLAAVGGEAVISDAPEDISAASGLVLPGVGSFESAMEYVNEAGQGKAILDALGRGVPFLGICLGLQLLFARGEERSGERGLPHENEEPVAAGTPGDDRWVAGLGFFAGSVTRLRSGRLKVPHVGWDQVYPTEVGERTQLLRGVPSGANFYFTHSYALADDVDSALVAARTHYARSFGSAIVQGAVFGVQFHPEKSSATGLAVLSNFVDIVRAGGVR